MFSRKMDEMRRNVDYAVLMAQLVETPYTDRAADVHVRDPDRGSTPGADMLDTNYYLFSGSVKCEASCKQRVTAVEDPSGYSSVGHQALGAVRPRATEQANSEQRAAADIYIKQKRTYSYACQHDAIRRTPAW